jgi:prolyl-tRNA editing enzyme YbaK/EbsC (Cys-tRNA(Pro) deacylase)
VKAASRFEEWLESRGLDVPVRTYPAGTRTAEDAARAIGCEIGGVPPFGHATAMAVYMDRDLNQHDVVWAAAGRPDAVFPISPARLADLSGALVERLA